MPVLQKLQSASRRNHSVETAVTKVYNNLIIDKSRGKDTILVLLGFSAAFEDTLPNDLVALGIDRTVVERFR